MSRGKARVDVEIPTEIPPYKGGKNDKTRKKELQGGGEKCANSQKIFM